MMTEEKDTTEEIEADVTPEPVVASEAAVVIDLDAPEPATDTKQGEVLEELPEEIKKKLEKQKANRQTMKGKKKKKVSDKRVTAGKAFINSTYNNTIVTLTDNVGNVISWSNAGLAGFKGPKKSTPYAAQIITRIAVEKAKEFGLSEVKVFVKGVGTGRESAVRALNANGLNVTYIKDITPQPHNGCRSRKPRRV
jgi:small subunit ribosomal protein S11